MKDLHIWRAIKKQLQGRTTPISTASVLTDIPSEFYERGKFLLWWMCWGGYIAQTSIKLLGPTGNNLQVVYKWNEKKARWSEKLGKWV